MNRGQIEPGPLAMGSLFYPTGPGRPSTPSHQGARLSVGAPSGASSELRARDIRRATGLISHQHRRTAGHQSQARWAASQLFAICRRKIARSGAAPRAEKESIDSAAAGMTTPIDLAVEAAPSTPPTYTRRGGGKQTGPRDRARRTGVRPRSCRVR